MGECCLRGFKWDAQPQGKDTTLAGRPCYVTGSEAQDQIGIMVIHDVFGWTFTNTRVLADHFAAEIGATVYVPDLYVKPACSPERGEDVSR
jgi:dienelactone hydrolase